MPTEQKSAMASMLSGLIPMTDGQKKLFAEELAVSERLRKHLPSVMDAALAAPMATLAAQETALTNVRTQAEQQALQYRERAETAAKASLEQVETRAKQYEAQAATAAEPQKTQLLTSAKTTRDSATQQHLTAMTAAKTAYEAQTQQAATTFAVQLEVHRAAVRAAAIKVLEGVDPLQFLS